MGVTLDWSSAYPSIIDTIETNFPVLTNDVHLVRASHVNQLANAVVALENAVASVSGAYLYFNGSLLLSPVQAFSFYGNGLSINAGEGTAQIFIKTGQYYVYDPGATATGNIYNDFSLLVSDLYSANTSTPGPKTVYCVNNGGSCDIPAGDWNVNNVKFVGSQATSPPFGGSPTMLKALNGARLSGEFIEFSSITLTSESTSPVLVNEAGITKVVRFTDGALLLGDGNYPIISQSADSGTIFTMFLSNSVCPQAPCPASPIYVDSGAGTLVYLSEGCYLSPYALSGPPGAHVDILVLSASSSVAAQALWSGDAISPTIVADAKYTQYNGINVAVSYANLESALDNIIVPTVQTTVSNISVNTDTGFLAVDTTAGNVLVIIPDAWMGRTLRIKKTNTGANTITVQPPSTMSLEGNTVATSVLLPNSNRTDRPSWEIWWESPAAGWIMGHT